MQQKNLLLWITLSLLLYFGAWKLQDWLWPPRPPKPQPKKLPASWVVSDVVAQTSAAIAVAPAGVGQACQFAAACQAISNPQVAALPTRDMIQVAAAKAQAEKKE